MIADSNDTIKDVWWKSFIHSVEKGKTYESTNFTNKVDKYGIYIGNGTSVEEVQGAEGVVDERELAEREIECTDLVGWIIRLVQHV